MLIHEHRVAVRINHDKAPGPVVASSASYNLADVVEAHRFVDTGRKRGNVVLRVHQFQGQTS